MERFGFLNDENLSLNLRESLKNHILTPSSSISSIKGVNSVDIFVKDILKQNLSNRYLQGRLDKLEDMVDRSYRGKSPRMLPKQKVPKLGTVDLNCVSDGKVSWMSRNA